MDDLKRHLEDLRKAYIKATPQQRIHVAKQRIEYPDCGPNKIIVLVSAVEAFARAKVLEIDLNNGINIEDAYRERKKTRADKLIEIICAKKTIKPEKLFSKKVWEDFICAIEYRNLLIHECTFLRGGISARLIKATEKILKMLQEI